MLISYKWLSELVAPDLPPYELADKLTLVGLEIDGIREHGDDVVFDIEITSNRGDCLSHFGVSREVSAFSGNPVNLPGKLVEKPVKTELVEIQAPEICSRFTARLIRGITVGPSPEWLIKKLEAVGERSINNIADITNLVMHELGQPMHAFDLDRLSGSRIVVRMAEKGESIKTLDEVERNLTESMLAICDDKKPAAVAGVMGGFDSAIGEDSKNVLLEVAYFDAASIRETSNGLNLSTEASYRFERGVDIENLIRASNRAAELICELAGGELGEFCDDYPIPMETVTIPAPDVASELERLTGVRIDSNAVDTILSRLGIEKESEGLYRIPSWRHDLSITEDLVEETVRIHGYDQIDEALPPSSGAGEYHQDEDRKRRLRTIMSAQGFDEAISYSFVDSARSARFVLSTDVATTQVRIKDPIIEGADLMRTTLLTGLMDAVRTNLNHRAEDLRIFEIGKVFRETQNTPENGLPDEREMLGIVITGRERLEGSAVGQRSYDYFDLKAAVEQAADTIGIHGLKYSEAEEIAFFQTGQSAMVKYDGVEVGRLGKIDSSISSMYKFKQPVFVAELDLTRLLEKPEEVSVYMPLPVYPSVTRDVSIVVPKDISYGQITGLLENGKRELLESVSLVDTYSGSGIQEDERSVTIRIEYRSQERTLTDEEVDAVHRAVLESLKTEFDARFR